MSKGQNKRQPGVRSVVISTLILTAAGKTSAQNQDQQESHFSRFIASPIPDYGRGCAGITAYSRNDNTINEKAFEELLKKCEVNIVQRDDYLHDYMHGSLHKEGKIVEINPDTAHSHITGYPKGLACAADVLNKHGEPIISGKNFETFAERLCEESASEFPKGKSPNREL